MPQLFTKTEERQYERIPTEIYQDSVEASLYVANEIADLIKSKAETGEMAVLGLATGSTPTGVYDELVRMHKEDGLSFQNVITFNLDEYYPIEPDALQSYVRYMHEYLFDHIDIKPENVHIPDGTLDRDEILDYCRQYEQNIQDAGGLDIQILGIGRTGHIGFNEPGSTERTRTRLITLDEITRTDAAADFYGKENVPRRAITMGIGTILEADKIFMMAWGEKKAPVIKEAIEGEISDHVPATYLQNHDNVEIILDEGAAELLTRRKTPWLTRPIEWDDDMIRRAVVWLCKTIDKPILKLTDEDYNEHGMSDIVTEQGPAYNTNIKVFNEVQHTITGWPGGKPDADDTNRPERAEPFPKRALIFSPHPGDDVISMGGTLLRLVDHGHDVHVAYQTSGNIAVRDEEAIRFADFVNDYHDVFDVQEKGNNDLFKRVNQFLAEKSADQVDTDEILTIKELIRKGEAKSACRYAGISSDRVHFLKMPFYETGRIRKKPLSEDDIQLLVELIRDVKPHQIYAAGDLSDPHGTQRICLSALEQALDQVKDENWFQDCYVWLYRGTWREYEANEIEMAVPLSPDELARKRRAIFKHESQKDNPLYPGSDSREFWERAEELTRSTARTYDDLGLAEYEAIEGFVRWKIG